MVFYEELPLPMLFIFNVIYHAIFMIPSFMYLYQFNLQDFVDIVLSKTQRKTPTVVHKQYKISRIRQFYTRKIKFSQQTFHDKLTQIITDFPKLEVK